MPKVLCTLPNASDEIGGIKFTQHAKGMLSEDLSDEQAKRLASIPGYEMVGAAAPAPASNAAADAAAAAEKAEAERAEAERIAAEKEAAEKANAAERAELVAKAEALGMKVKGNWSLERLKTEVEAAEKAKAEADAAAAAEAAKDSAGAPGQEGNKAE